MVVTALGFGAPVRAPGEFRHTGSGSAEGPRTGGWGWGSGRILGLIALGIVGIAAFILVEVKMKDDALIPMRLFRSSTFSLGLGANVLIGFGMFGAISMLPLYLQLVKGSTPTQSGLLLLPLLEAFQPTHVLVMLGTNDVRRHGRRHSHRMLSTAESRRNLLALTDVIVNDLQAEVVVLTPPTADQVRIDIFFQDSAVRWAAAELDEVAQAVRNVATHCIDVHAALNGQHLGDLMEFDGVHLNLAGQQVLARVVQAVASGVPGGLGSAAGSAFRGQRVG